MYVSAKSEVRIRPVLGFLQQRRFAYLGPCLHLPVTLLHISTLSITRLNPVRVIMTPPTTTTSTSPTGDTWVVQVCPALA